MQALQHVNITFVCVGMLSPCCHAQNALALAEVENLAGMLVCFCMAGSHAGILKPLCQSHS